MKILIDYWYLVIVGLACIITGGLYIYSITKLPRKKQIEKVKEWLLFAVSVAEKELGSKTGQIKLRYVYDLFLKRFPYMSKVIPFKTFSKLVDEALDNLEELLQKNDSVKKYVKGEEAE